MKVYKNIEQYIASFPVGTQKLLKTMYQTIKKVVPAETKEIISYGIPTFKLKRNLVHFGGYPHHVSLYPGAEAIKVFSKELENHKTSKGTIQFPLDKPLPTGLITKIVQFCVAQNQAKN